MRKNMLRMESAVAISVGEAASDFIDTYRITSIPSVTDRDAYGNGATFHSNQQILRLAMFERGVTGNVIDCSFNCVRVLREVGTTGNTHECLHWAVQNTNLFTIRYGFYGMINYDRGLCSGAVIMASREAAGGS